MMPSPAPGAPPIIRTAKLTSFVRNAAVRSPEPWSCPEGQVGPVATSVTSYKVMSPNDVLPLKVTSRLPVVVALDHCPLHFPSTSKPKSVTHDEEKGRSAARATSSDDVVFMDGTFSRTVRKGFERVKGVHGRALQLSASDL